MACEPRGEEQGSVFDEWAAAVVEQSTLRWGGQRVARVFAAPPAAGVAQWRSWRTPLRLHAARPVASAALAQWGMALEQAYLQLQSADWPLPLPDLAGGSSEFDVYLQENGDWPTVHTACCAPPAPLDAALSFATLPWTPVAAPRPCVVLALLAEAGLHGLDPAEAPPWRTATAHWLAATWLGSSACLGAAFAYAQGQCDRGLLPEHGPPGTGALLVAYLAQTLAPAASARPQWVRQWWDFARQRTWDDGDWRGSPDLWETLAVLAKAQGRRLIEVVRSFNLWRWSLPELPDAVWQDAPRPTTTALAWPTVGQPQRYWRPRPLQAWGTQYLRLKRSAPTATGELRVWLTGEYGVRWSLQLVRLDAQGRRRGTVQAPVRRAGQVYLPLQLDTKDADVLIVVTNLSSRPPDADVRDDNGRAFRLTAQWQPRS